MDIPALYHSLVMKIGDGTGASDSLLHVHAGLAVMFAARMITGRSLATPVPFLVVCLAELANEILDRIAFGAWRMPDTAYDIANTLFWPFVLMLGLRIRKQRLAEPRPPTS